LSRRERRRGGPGSERLRHCDRNRWRGAADTALERGSESDREWFEGHPGLNYRLRRSLPGEVPLDPDRHSFMLVKQLKPGIRLRVRFLLDSPPSAEDLPESAGDEMMALARRSSPRLAEIEASLIAAGIARDGGGE
jgi:hypothetical protein